MIGESRESAIIKPWGTSTPLFSDATIEVARVDIRRGGYSSIHKHRNKHNLFWVLSGTLKVMLFRLDDFEQPRMEKVITPQMLPFSVLNDTWHRFEALEDVICNEIYMPAPGRVVVVGEGDIVRTEGEFGLGGVRG